MEWAGKLANWNHTHGELDCGHVSLEDSAHVDSRGPVCMGLFGFAEGLSI